MDSKHCPGCNESKPITEFNFKDKATGKRQVRCRACTQLQLRRHYNAHREYYIQKARKRTARITAEQSAWILAYLRTHPCVDCGEADTRCLDFDHVRGKKIMHVSRMIGDYRWEKIVEEIQKCEVRCSNCHRKRTAERREVRIRCWLKMSARSSTG